MGGDPACFNLPVGAAVTAYLGLGSNVGDREVNLQNAIEELARIVVVEKTSSIYETAPVGYTDQPNFCNMVARIRTDLPARELMAEILKIEEALGRKRTFRNAPRVIDIDILLYDDVVIDEPALHVPHERMHERMFVLQPLLEIAPDIKDPRTGQRFAVSGSPLRPYAPPPLRKQ